MRIDALSGIGMTPIPTASPGIGRSGGFNDLLLNAVRDVNGIQAGAESAVTRLAAGEELPGPLIASAVTQADLSMRTMIQIRNKLVQAWDELRQMQI